MEGQVIDSLSLSGSAVQDFSVWGLFLQADIVVKIVIIVLIAASIWTWAIIFDKAMRLRRLKTKAAKFEETFWSGGSLEDLYDRMDGTPADPLQAVFISAMREWRRSSSRGLKATDTVKTNMRDRIGRVMDITIGREMERLERSMVFLASVGSSAPFIGLFGTVWGIMNAFVAIGVAKNTSLAVVAPGIAEALFATALGLVAAIPATLAFNKISNDLARYAARLEAFSGEFGAILSRQLDERT